MKHAKKYNEAAKKILPDTLYPIDDAFKLVKETSSVKFDATVEVAMRLNVDPRKADQMVRGTVSLPHGTGKTARVLVFAVGDKAADAEAAGADFDVAVATPDLMGKVGRLGKVLGPRGLMPNPKTGTVTMDVAKAVKDIKGGRIEFRVDKHANLQFIVGKCSFEAAQLAENFRAVLEEIERLRPATIKGRYITKAVISTTMGPSIPLSLATKE